MKLRTALFLAAGLLIAGVGCVFGQAGWLLLASPTGAELVPIQTTGALQNYTPLNTIRNTTGYLLSSKTSGTQATTAATDNLLLTGAVGTLTVDVPAKPPDSSLFAICNASGSNFSGTITVSSTDSSTFVPSSPTISNLAASTCEEWQYTVASAVWYRIR